MAVAENPLTSGGSTTDAASFATDSITPAANALVLLAVLSSLSSTPNTPTATGNGLTWVEVANITFNPIATPRSKLTVLRALGASPSTGAITMDFAGQTQTAICWSVVEFAGVDTSGTDGSGAIVQSVTNQVNAQSTIFTVTLAAFESADNATYGAFGSDLNGSFTEGSGFTEIHDVAQVTANQTLQTEWRADNDTSVDVTPNATADMGGIAIEIKAAVGAGGEVAARYQMDTPGVIVIAPGQIMIEI